MPVAFHPDYVAPANPGSAYRWNKSGLVHALLRESDLAIDWLTPALMPVEWLTMVHDPGYVDEVIRAAVPPEKERRIGYAVTPAVARRAQRVPGGTYLAATAALDRGFAANIAGGSHHALADTGAGYCVFNDLAITAVRLVEEGLAARVLIVDCDVHQGDGTAMLCAGRPGIATYSIHAERNFPARKARSTLDVPLPDKTGNDAYIAALEDSLTPMLRDFAPDLILYQAGVDPFQGDRLGRLALSDDGLDRRDRLVAGLARRSDIPLVSTLGGGYGDDMMAVARRHVRSLTALIEVLTPGAPIES